MNEHAKRAREYVLEAQEQMNQSRADEYVAAAQVEATLALAYEQRTANLLHSIEYCDGDNYEPQLRQIMHRLGLIEEAF
jgi:hypothetical protein